MRAPILLLSLLFAGCALPPPARLVSGAQVARCDLDAAAGSGGNPVAASQSSAESRIRARCLRAAVFENAEAAGRLLGFRLDLAEPGPILPEHDAALVGLAEGCGAPRGRLGTIYAADPVTRPGLARGQAAAPAATPAICAFARGALAATSRG